MTSEQQQFISKKYREKRSFLLEYALSSLHNPELSEEAVQQTFEIACRRIDDFYNSPNPDGWLTRTLSFLIRNMERQQAMENRLFLTSGDYRPDLAKTQDDLFPLRVAFGPLVDMPQFQLLYELEVLERPIREVARDLGISKSACRKRVERAKAFLRKKLEE